MFFTQHCNEKILQRIPCVSNPVFPSFKQIGPEGLAHSAILHMSEECGFSPPLRMNDASLDGIANQISYHKHIPGIYSLTAMHELMSHQTLVDQHTSCLRMLTTMKALMFHQMTVEQMCNLTYHGNMDAQHRVHVVDVSSQTSYI